MPREVRVRAHYAVRLVTVSVADKTDTCLVHVKSPPAASCRVFKVQTFTFPHIKDVRNSGTGVLADTNQIEHFEQISVSRFRDTAPQHLFLARDD